MTKDLEADADGATKQSCAGLRACDGALAPEPVCALPYQLASLAGMMLATGSAGPARACQEMPM